MIKNVSVTNIQTECVLSQWNPKKNPDGLGPYHYIHTTCFPETSSTAH